jgi:6-phosphofructokinase 2
VAFAYWLSNMKSIYTLTLSPAIDKSSTVDQVMAEHKLRCSQPSFEPGGGGINVSRAIKKLGGESVAVYPKGGPTGDLLQQLLNKEGINQHTVPCNNWIRENFTVVENSGNRQFRFGFPGAPLSESEWKKCLADLEQHSIDYMVVSGSTPPGVPLSFYSQLADIARKKGAKLILDTSGEALEKAMEAGIYLLKPNLKELSELAGEELKDISQQEKAAMKIIKKGKIEILIVSLGAFGAMLASKEGVIHVAAPSVAKKSTVGAGDSMVAGVVLSLSKGWSLEDSLKYGVACGTAATMNPGTELCKLEDVENLYK